jgi:flagellar biosynthetic protein FliR
MISLTSEMLNGWVIGLLWPLTRILGVIAAAPIFSHSSIPMASKLGFGLVLTLVIMTTIPSIPNFDIVSVEGLALLLEQVIIGLAMGFSMRLVFAAVEVAGQLISLTMGLGFATFYDPQTGGQTPSLGQLIVLISLLLFLSLDGHLILIAGIAKSFVTLPISLSGGGPHIKDIAFWGKEIFSIGLLLALPTIAALLITNMALGVLTRAAPQLNIFGIGFPVTITVGFMILVLTLPSMLIPMQNMIAVSFEHMREVMTVQSSEPIRPN